MPAATADLMPILRQVLIDGTPLHRHLSLQIVDQDGQLAVRLPDSPSTKNHLGTQGAPALFAAGDCACATAVIAAFGIERVRTSRAVVGEAHTRFRRPAPGAVLARGSIVDARAAVATFDADGRIAMDVTAELFAEDGGAVGDMSLTWHLTRVDPTDA